MNRREFTKQAALVAATATVMPELAKAADARSYDSSTLSVRLVEEEPGTTSVYLIEHGDADYVIIHAFYWVTLNGQKLMLSKETTTPLIKGAAVGADLALDVGSIVFLRVHELKLLGQTEFGETPDSH